MPRPEPMAGASPPAASRTRFEILPFARGEEEARQLTQPVELTVTCSPRHGIDATLDVAERVRAQGHAAVVHVAAKMIRDDRHLDAMLERMAVIGVQDAFVVGGDSTQPLGPYGSAVELVPVIAQHPLRPARIGVGAYPEGHPLIDGDALQRALEAKAQHADYLVTQLCFDPELLLRWLARQRERGLTTPAYVGLPGLVDRRKLLEISMLVGVGASVSFLRKQNGLRRLMSRPSRVAQRMQDALEPAIGDPHWGIAGLHYYTFNRLVDTWTFHATRGSQRAAAEAAG